MVQGCKDESRQCCVQSWPVQLVESGGVHIDTWKGGGRWILEHGGGGGMDFLTLRGAVEGAGAGLSGDCVAFWNRREGLELEYIHDGRWAVPSQARQRSEQKVSVACLLVVHCSRNKK
jgi:outer membrane lipoprotein SlyB